MTWFYTTLRTYDLKEYDMLKSKFEFTILHFTSVVCVSLPLLLIVRGKKRAWNYYKYNIILSPKINPS